MDAQEYSDQQSSISATLALLLARFGRFFSAPRLSDADWIDLLRMVYPEVERARSQAAALARAFYDDERARFFPGLPRHDQFLEGYRFEWFVQNMEPARKRMQLPDTPQDRVAVFVAQGVREVENAGRRQLIHAVESDDRVLETVDEQSSAGSSGENRLIRGWARVATGRETCAWCLMLVSRGPVYESSASAGLNVPDSVAIEHITAGFDVSEYMDQWHPNCDCKVVPVFKISEWDGRHAWKRAEQLWIDASKEAQSLLDSGEARTDNKNRETLNALRRRIAHGEISNSDFAALSAA